MDEGYIREKKYLGEYSKKFPFLRKPWNKVRIKFVAFDTFTLCFVTFDIIEDKHRNKLMKFMTSRGFSLVSNDTELMSTTLQFEKTE
jgi:hypothetical protein